MTDRERHQLHGPVRSLCLEWASINPETSEWEPATQGPTFTFNREGRQEGRVRDDDHDIRCATALKILSPDGVSSTLEYEYDERGRVAPLTDGCRRAASIAGRLPMTPAITSSRSAWRADGRGQRAIAAFHPDGAVGASTAVQTGC